MASRLGWVDQDDKQRQAMIAVTELFKEDGTVDELGIGSIRDSVADALFPGTSVLLTRARYLVMIPWLLQRVSATCTEPREAPADLRRLEGRLILSLLKGEEDDGVIGRFAKQELKRMPSAAYWNALGQFGIRNPGLSIESLLRQDITARRGEQRAAHPDDPGAERDAGPSSLHPDLPLPPEDLLVASSLELTAAEADFLRERMELSTRGTLLAWLLERGVPSSAGLVWEHDASDAFPADAHEYVDSGRRFHTLVHGAALVYNSLLADLRGEDDLIATYDRRINDWSEELEDATPLSDGWSVERLWELMARRRTPVREGTRTFVTTWARAVADQGADAARAPAMKALVRQRELTLKGGRARVSNRDALNAWTGGSGLVRLDYRWAVASRLINDVLAPAKEPV